MKQLFDDAQEVLGGRTQWEQKQRIYSQMRHDGLRRRNKPWPSAADLHFPLVDMNIRKSKPFWESQAIQTEHLASFVSLKEQQSATTTAAAEFYDFETKQNSAFEVELIRAIDFMLLRGRGVLKCVVDPFDNYRLVDEAIDPMFIIMADGADDFEDADWFVHVQQISVPSFKRDRRYQAIAEDTAALNRIRGQKDYDVAGGVLQDKAVREGINFSRLPNQIIRWEHYVKTMDGWTVYTYSPQAPDLELRKPFGVPYKMAGKFSIPFFSFKTEVKDKGWYSPRGLAELGAPFEQYACKLWNEKTDAMTFANRPVLTSETALPNTANMKWVPGEFVPGNVKGVAMPAPAFSFDQEIAFTRSISEQQAMMPDFGIQQPGQPAQAGSPRTATENNRIATLQTVGTESNGRLFRLDLAKVHRHRWGLMLQFKRADLTYYAGKELKQLPEDALHDAYMIVPDGAPDQWNKQLRQQRADGRLQKFAGNPRVDQDVLVRDSLAADDAKLALEAFIPSGDKAASESEDEAQELTILREGYPAEVRPDEDHVARIHVLLGWIQKQMQMGAPIDPIARQRVQEHLAVHWTYLKQINPQAAKQLAQEIQQMEQGAVSAAPPQPPPADVGNPS